MRKSLVGWVVAGVATVAALGWVKLSPAAPKAPKESPVILSAPSQPQAEEPASPPRLEARPLVGYPAPDFSLRDLDGKPVSLSALRGKVVFVNFWATWCGPCRQEMPEMKRLYDEKIPDLVILAVNLTTTEGAVERVGQFMAEFNYKFPALLDTEGEAAEKYRLLSIPTSVFVGPDGVIKAKHYGPMTLATMETYIVRARKTD